MEVENISSLKSLRKQPTAVSRMKQDYLRLKRDPLPYITAEPLPSNILEWHYVVKGPEDSPYFGGYYHGCLLFSREFPFKPPSIYMHTPNGRFQTNTRLCLSISDFHPDTWNPTWSVGTILTGLLSFMLESTATLGSIETTACEKQVLARKSLAFNMLNPHFVELFPDISEEIRQLQSENQLQLKEFNVGASDKINIQADTKNNGTVANVDSARAEIYDYAVGSDVYVANSMPMADADYSTSLSDSYLNWQINAMILICFAIFACVVNYVIQNINYG